MRMGTGGSLAAAAAAALLFSKRHAAEKTPSMSDLEEYAGA